MHARSLTVALMLAGVPNLVFGQAGAPVEGMTATAGQAGVFVMWEGTEDDPGHTD